MALDKLKALIAELASDNNIPDLSVDENAYIVLNVDNELTINMQYIEDTDNLYIFAEIGILPEQAAGKIAKELLAANLFGLKTGGGVLAMQEDSKVVVFSYNLHIGAIDSIRFNQVLNNVTQYALYWQNALAELSNTSLASSNIRDDFNINNMLRI